MSRKKNEEAAWTVILGGSGSANWTVHAPVAIFAHMVSCKRRGVFKRGHLSMLKGTRKQINVGVRNSLIVIVGYYNTLEEAAAAWNSRTARD